jgi:SAM-dependent methyltransferase
MQAYGQAFAQIYNLRWGGFARQVAPRIREFYESTPAGQDNRNVLDLACGAGQLAQHFLEKGYRVTGMDLSESMLEYARQNAAGYLESGYARFIQADARDFMLDQPVGLVVSTFDALNHLENFIALKSCFRSAHAALTEEGIFIFDLNTRLGLKRAWNSISIEDTEELTLINRGIYDGFGDRAYTRITGFIRTPEGSYERFEETVYNTVFDIEAAQSALLEAGFSHAYPARIQDLGTPVEDPESEGRVFFVARK